MTQGSREWRMSLLSCSKSVVNIVNSTVSFGLGEPIMVNPQMVRGFIGRQLKDHVAIHHHKKGGRLRYRYPFVQYRVIEGTPMVIGIADDAALVADIYESVTQLRLNGKSYEVFEKSILVEKVDYGISSGIIFYDFLSPWLALNEKNYEIYQRVRNWEDKKKLLEKILIGNIISMSKGLGYTVPEPIKASIGKLREVSTSLKGTPMLGFLGTFSINFEVPDYWGIGKSVSRGFGVVKRI